MNSCGAGVLDALPLGTAIAAVVRQPAEGDAGLVEERNQTPVQRMATRWV